VSLTAAELALVVARWRRDLLGAQLRRAISPAADDRIALELHGPAGEAHLEIVLAPRACRLCRIAARPAAAERPHPFVMLLRREAVGLRLAGVRQIGDDRVAALDFAASGAAGSLVCELTARHGNLFWVDAAGAIAGSFHPNRSHRRPLVPGAPYVPPAPRQTPEPAAARFADGDRLEAEIAAAYAAIEEGAALAAERAELARAARRAGERLARLEENLARDRARAAEAERLQAHAHLLQANLRAIPRGAREVALTGFDGAPVTVPLDPARDAVANMTRLFEKAKRLKRAAPRIDERARQSAAARAALAVLAARIDAADAPGLAAARAELARLVPGSVPAAPRSRRAAPERSPFHELAIAAGRTARVGRSAADNDALTLRFARPDDLWLHARGEAGSHVVVPMGRGEEPTPELLVDAAHLAAFYSKARERGEVEVTYTRRRYVQKPRGAPPGSVRLLREKTIFVKIEPERLARLLGRDQ